MAPGQELNLLILLFLLFLFVPAWPGESQPLEVTGAVGGAAFLSSRRSLNPQEYSQIHWRWKNRAKIASWVRGGKAQYPQSPFEGRLELLENFTLRISPLRIGDNGSFQLYLEDDKGREEVETVLLKVYGLVPKPNVSATITTSTTSDGQRCDAVLRCSVGLEGVTYEWIPPRKLLEKGGQVLRVSFDPEVESYVCRVSNPVSSNNASLTYRHPCRWTGESSSVTSRSVPGIPAALGHLILLFLLLTMA